MGRVLRMLNLSEINSKKLFLTDSSILFCFNLTGLNGNIQSETNDKVFLEEQNLEMSHDYAR